MSRRAPSLCGTVLLALVVAGGVAWLREPNATGVAPAASSPSLTPRPAESALGALAAVRAPLDAKEGGAPSERVGLWMLDDPALPAMVGDVLLATRFPPDARPLTEEALALSRPNRRYDTAAALETERGARADVAVLFTADRFRVLGDDPLATTLTVTSEAPIDAKVVRVQARDAAGTVAPFDVGPAKRTGPETFALTFTAADTPLAKLTGLVVLDAEIALVDGDTGHATLQLEHQAAGSEPARFTGDVADVLADGSVLWRVALDVDVAGSYRVDANVLDATGAPIAALLARTELTVGRQLVTLRLFGRIAREAGAHAPFSLVDVRGHRFVPGQSPDREHMRDLPGAYASQPYDVDALSADEHWDARKEARVRRLLEQARTGAKPPLAAPVGG